MPAASPTQSPNSGGFTPGPSRSVSEVGPAIALTLAIIVINCVAASYVHLVFK